MVEVAAPGAAGISEVAAVLGLLWEVPHRSIDPRLRQRGHRLRPRGPVWVVEVQVLAIGRPFNRGHGRVQEPLPAHAPQHNRVLVQVAGRGLDRDKESVRALGLRIVPPRGPGRRIVPPRVRGKESRIVRESRNNRRGCRAWELVRPREQWQADWRETAWPIELRESDSPV